MRELTIEEKAQRYDEILARAEGANLPYYKEDIMSKVKEFVDYLLPELEESEEEKIKKQIIGFITYSKILDETKKNWIAWLEKQSEQNPVDKIQIGKKYKCIASPRYSTFVKGLIYKPEDKFLCSLMNFCHDCFEPIEDVEPKFHIGDWVVSPTSVYWHIDRIENNRYEVTSDTGKCADWSLDTDLYHLWTIQDAKDGDVLSYRDGQWIFIYKEKIDDNSFYYHTLYSTIQGLTISNAGFTLLNDAIIPATKEQRDTLFAKMKEKGYEWDAEKKELKKIEQKSATMSLDEAIEHCKEKSCGNNACALEHKQLEKWLTELKELKEQKPAEWSEEDECFLNRIITKLEIDIRNWEGHGKTMIDSDKELISWLKSLKDRV